MRDYVLLFINGQPFRVDGGDVFLTLSDFLRRRERLTGTKVVCAEGDCGSCSVLLGRVDDGQLRYRAIASCIQTIFQLDATHIVTVEGLREVGELNPIQDALVQCQGTQCGFCTPGFVVALYALMHEGQPCNADTVRRGLTGNLCRCTGYDSIIRAALTTDRSKLKSLDALYPPGPLIEALIAASREEVRIEAPPCRFYKPVTIDAATRFRADNPGAATVAGGSDLGVVHNKQVRLYAVAMSTAALAELRAIRVEPDSLVFGASASLADVERVTLQHLPELGRFMDTFGSPLVRNVGTIAGNLVTASPIGDTIPALTVLGAEVELAGTGGTRRVPLTDFYTGYRTTVLTPDEIVTTVRIPLLAPNETFKLYKVSRRKDLDISSFSAAFRLHRTADRIDDIRIAYGGVGPIVMKMTQTEAVLRGQTLSADLFARAADIARDEVKPLTDVRGSDTYRRSLSANILLKLWHDLRGDASFDAAGNGHPHMPTPATRTAAR